MMKGYYSEHKLYKIHYPTAPGWEGAGIVVQSGGGWCGVGSLLGWRVMGQRVACVRTVLNDEEMVTGGCMQQYVVCDAITCLPLPDSVDTDKGSMHFVNPLTAIGLVERIQLYKGQAAVQTCAAG